MIKKRNILITASNFPSGSASANYLNLFCKGLVECDENVEVYLIKGYWSRGASIDHKRSNTTAYGVKYTFLGFRNRPSKKIYKVLDDLYRFIKLFLLLISFTKDRKLIIIYNYNNEFPYSFIINIFCKIFNILIITFVPEYYDNSVFSGNIFRKLKWYAFLIDFYFVNKYSSKLIVFSNYLRSKYIEKGYPADKILVQPNLTDFEYWKDEYSPTQFTVGYSGTPSKKDGIGDLLQAISLLRSKNLNVNAIIIGDVFSGKSVVGELTNLCMKLGIENYVFFTGLVTLEEVRFWLNKCTILTLTRPDIIQTKAGFPTKIGEYFACKKIVLATRVGDITFYFTDRKEIIFADAGNPESIAVGIEWILSNMDRYEEIATSGYKKANELLNYKTAVGKILNFINE